MDWMKMFVNALLNAADAKENLEKAPNIYYVPAEAILTPEEEKAKFAKNLSSILSDHKFKELIFIGIEDNEEQNIKLLLGNANISNNPSRFRILGAISMTVQYINKTIFYSSNNKNDVD